MIDRNDQDDFDANHGDTLTPEAADTRDVSEGVLIAAVGGAVVGGLAGGPVGAIIGGVVGGAAGGTAVAVVEKYENDNGKTTAEYVDSNFGIIPPNGTVSDADYQRHFASRYAGTDEQYGRHQPAYDYGYTIAALPQYQNHDWDTVQTLAAEDWKTKSEHDWDKVKDSVRFGWESARNKPDK